MAVATYKLDSTRVTLREYWWGNPNPLIVVAVLIKLLHVKIPSSTDDIPIESLAPFCVAETDVPPAVLERMAPLAAALAVQGFVDPIFFAVHQAPAKTDTYLGVVRHPSGKALACVHERDWHLRSPPKVKMFVDIVSAFSDGGFILSTNAKPDMLAPGSYEVHRQVGAAVPDLWANHQAAVAQVRGRTLLPVDSVQALATVLEHHHAALRDFHLERGVFVALTPREVAQAAQEREKLEARKAGGLDADLLAEMDRQLTGTTSGWTQLVILVVSAVAFFIAAGPAATWPIAVALVPILFFHEMGHYVCMRLFDYQNVRMFFIPFLGAAVMGRHLNAPGWKKAVVALMGPLPGIVVGVALGVVGLAMGQKTMIEIALLVLIINGYNLLPILPLDGGRAAQVVIFSRHAMLDAGFGVVAGVACLALGLLPGALFFLFIGVALLVNIPVSYKQAKIAADLQREGGIEESIDGKTIPQNAAQRILVRVKAAFPRTTVSKQIAQRALNVYETINARPPNALASVGLAGVHVGAFVVALVFAGALMLGRHGGFGALLRAHAAGPKASVAVKDIQTWQAPTAQTPPAPDKHTTVIATYPGEQGAKSEFADIQAQHPPGEGAMLFGQSVVVALPDNDDAARQKWEKHFEDAGAKVASDAPGSQADWTLMCTAPSDEAAQALQEELGDYLQAPGDMHLVPPWQAPDARAPQERRQHALARRTFQRMQSAGFKSLTSAKLKDVATQMSKAIQANDAEALKRAAEDQQKAMGELRVQELQDIAAEGPDKVDVGLANRYIELAKAAKFARPTEKDVLELGPAMGQLPMVDGKVDTQAGRVAARSGLVTHDGPVVTVHWLAFEDALAGPPALLRWLEERGSGSFKYSCEGSSGLGTLGMDTQD